MGTTRNRDYRSGVCIHDLVREQAERTPEAIALVSPATTFRYRELDQCGQSTCADAARHGVGPDVPVGIFSIVSPEMVLALLAVLKAGGAYVPLDPIIRRSAPGHD